MEETEIANLRKLSGYVQMARRANQVHVMVPVEALGSMTCAAGRLEYLETTLEGLTLSLVPDIRSMAISILGWTPDLVEEHRQSQSQRQRIPTQRPSSTPVSSSGT